MVDPKDNILFVFIGHTRIKLKKMAATTTNEMYAFRNDKLRSFNMGIGFSF